jgi:hypothetical protein
MDFIIFLPSIVGKFSSLFPGTKSGAMLRRAGGTLHLVQAPLLDCGMGVR